MKIKYKKTSTKMHPYLVTINDATLKELRECNKWLQRNLKIEGHFGNYMSNFINDNNETLLEVKFCKEADVAAFKLAFE